MMLAHRIRIALADPGPLLSGKFAADLADAGWRFLFSSSLNRDNYSTSRVLSGDPTNVRHSLFQIPVRNGHSANVEAFGDSFPEPYRRLGMVEATSAQERLDASLGRGLMALAAVPAAIETVAHLAVSIHCLETADRDCDVSYSDPEVPFSIFVGVHSETVPDEPLRMAEAILHETMHLQLSLAERIVALVDGTDERWTSPWRGCPRPTQGVLHGLYVFAAIREFLGGYRERANAEASQQYLQRRLDTIDGEIADAALLVGSQDLTTAGRALVQRLTQGIHASA